MRGCYNVPASDLTILPFVVIFSPRLGILYFNWIKLNLSTCDKIKHEILIIEVYLIPLSIENNVLLIVATGYNPVHNYTNGVMVFLFKGNLLGHLNIGHEIFIQSFADQQN